MSRYVDITSCIQVLGGLYEKPSLLENEKFHFSQEDFIEPFHKLMYGVIYNLYTLGASEMTPSVIEDYLKDKPQQFATFKASKGVEWLIHLKEHVQLSAFDYYYTRMKKMTFLRMINERAGMDLSWFYDVNNFLDLEKKEKQEKSLDDNSLEDISELINNKIESIRMSYVDNSDLSLTPAGTGVEKLIKNYLKAPEIGIPLYGGLNNAVTRGARLTKLYLRSASSGVGKTRAMIADCCCIGATEIYNSQTKTWDKNAGHAPTLFISTEQQLDELQTMMLAFIADVEEDHILEGRYVEDEELRVNRAAKVLENSSIYTKLLSDFSLQDIENTIKNSVREYGIHYIFHDYIHTSLKILSEVSGKSGIAGLKEHNILFMMAIKLKDLCVANDVFIETSTQLNGDYKNATIFDQNLLRGEQKSCALIYLILFY